MLVILLVSMTPPQPLRHKNKEMKQKFACFQYYTATHTHTQLSI